MSTNFPTTASVGSDLQAALGQSQVQETRTGGVQHMKFGYTTGEWIYGANNTECTDEILVINTQSIQHGWHLWVDGDITETMVPFVQPIPEEPAPVKDSKGKIQQASEGRKIEGMMIGEDGEAFPVSYANASFGCRKVVDTLLNEIRARAVSEPEFLYPKVKLTDTGETYENSFKEGEMVYTPLFEIVGWCNAQGVEQDGAVEAIEDASDEPEEATEEAPTPAKTRTRKRQK